MKAFVTEIWVDMGEGLALARTASFNALDVEDLRLALAEGPPLPPNVPTLLITREHPNHLQHIIDLESAKAWQAGKDAASQGEFPL